MSNRRTIAKLLCVLACLFLLSLGLFAQTVVTGELAGTITDPSGASITSATITLKSDATGDVHSAGTNTTGGFHISLLRPGSYTLTIAAKGFEQTMQKVTINLGQIQSVKIQLGIQSQTSIVTVSEQAPLTQTEDANLATTFDSNELANLPAPGNDMTSYAFTAPGVTVSTGAGYGNFTAFGLPADSNLYTINGSDNMDPYLNLNNSGASNLTLGSNELQEAAVVINGYTGQYGRQAGAQVNYVTKSGGNSFHGNAAFYYNESQLNANDFFNNSTSTDRPFAISREWAGSIGGPIVKNKLFFFYDNEGLRYVLPGGGPVFIPTADFASSVLNNLALNNPAATGIYTNAFNLYGTASGAGRAVPVTADLDSALGCGDYAGTNGWGVTKPCARTFQSSVNNLNIERLQAFKADYNISEKDRVYFRYNDDHGVQATGTDPINSAFNANSVQPSYGGQAGYTRVFSTNVVNQLLVSAMYYVAIFGPPDFAASTKTFPTTWQFGDGLYSNMGGSDTTYPQGRKVRQHQLIDDLSINHGSHVFKVGLNLRQNWVSTYATQPNTTGLYTFYSMTDFVNGSLANGSTYNQNFPLVGAEDVNMYSLGFYVQDEWKVKRNLTVTLALRMDRNSNINCGGKCFNELLSPFGAINHAATVPYNQSIHTGLSSAFPGLESIVPEPRIGIAYSVTPSTVLRGGFGIFTDLYQGLIADRFLTNSPGVISLTTASGLVALNNPQSALANVAASAAAFQNGFAQGATVAQLNSAVPGFAVPNYNTVANKLYNPKYYEWNFEVQQAIGKKYALTVNYVGNHGFDEIAQTAFANGYTKAGYTLPGLPTSDPDTRFGNVREINNNGWSNYDGLVTSFQWRTTSQFSGSFNYTWSHALDTLSNGGLEPFNNLHAPSIRTQISPLGLGVSNYGNSDYDTRSGVSGNFVYTTPNHFSNPILKNLLGGWTAASTVLFHSSYPYSIVTTGIRSTQTNNLTGLNNQIFLADWLGGSATTSCTTPGVPCFSKSQFATATSQHDFGNLARNAFRGMGYFDADLNISKTYAYRERYKVTVGAYLFNIFNHPNFDLPVNSLTSGTFGTINQTVSAPTSAYGSFMGSAVSGRVVQMLVKFAF